MNHAKSCSKIFLCLFSLILPILSHGQYYKLVGSVYDNQIKEPVQYANISVYNMPIGCCTNLDGDFVMNLPDSLASGRLIVSSIGYKSCSLPIDSLLGLETLVILLHPVEYQLDDVVVTPGENDAHTIMKRVISNINNNYSAKKYFLEAFFRHRVYNHMANDKTVRLTEAAISIHQDHSAAENKKVQINEIRNSNNYAELNTSIGQKLFYNALGGDQNPIYRTLLIERNVQKNFLKNLTKSEHYSVALNGLSFFDDALVYIIDFKQISWDFMFKNYKTSHTYHIYRYYINAVDFAIIKIELTWITHNTEMKVGNKNDSIMTLKFIQYKKFDEKYYPSYVYYFGRIPDMVAKNDTNNMYLDETELMVNEIATRRKDYDRIKNKNQISKNKVLWNIDYEYNPAFWENYNMLLDHPINQQYKKDLESEKQLEEQFNRKKNVKIGNK
jgi:hypothetical protein